MATPFWKIFAEKFKTTFGASTGKTMTLKADTQNQLTPEIAVIGGIMALPSGKSTSSKKFSTENPKENVLSRGLPKTLVALPIEYGPGYWGLGNVFLLVNYVQIVLTSLAEVAFRTAGLALVKTAESLIPRKKDPVLLKIAKGIFSPVTLALWTLGQTFSFVGETFAHTRAFLDSASHLLNPLMWVAWIAKAFNDKNVATEVPDFTAAARTFLFSTLKLLPAAAIIIAGFFTGGALLPAAHSASTLLATNIAIATTHITPLAIAGTTLLATAATAIAMTVSKGWTSFFTALDRTFSVTSTAKRQEVHWTEQPTRVSNKKTRTNPKEEHQESTTNILQGAHMSTKDLGAAHPSDNKPFFSEHFPASSSANNTPRLSTTEDDRDDDRDKRSETPKTRPHQ